MSLATDSISFSWAIDPLTVRVTATRLIALVSGIVVTVGMGLFLSRTRTGLMMRALADNRQVAPLHGFNGAVTF
ncbi:hypothetical protein [Pelagibacterium halotolerans]|uniref:hypothetical protein n=1 Tax=Pelagibacterium halotolerans TaxID=531813 RepID=UPI003850C031